MNKTLRLLSAAVLGAVAVACSSPEKMAKQAENVSVTCEPAVLEAVAGKVEAKITVTYPKSYFHPKAILEVTPVVVYEGGEVELPVLKYQGEKVQDNFKVVPSEGGTVTEKISFDFVPGMEKSYVELRSVVSYSGKKVNLPAKKVADGVNTTYMLANICTHGVLSAKYMPDAYQSVIDITEEGQILYNVNSAEVRNSELKGQSVKDFQAALDEIKANERKTLVGTEVVAYASPEGAEKLNNKLSDNRSASAEKAWKQVTKGHDASAPEVKSVGEDWEGFQSLVAASKIEDKDLILRVLSMYSDPAVRENEIKNISEVYTELKKDVLPELRRARFIAKVQYTNYSEDELKQLVDENIDELDEEALLHVATLVTTTKKLAIYGKAIEKFNSDRAQYNLAVAYLNLGNLAKAEEALAKVKADDDYTDTAAAVIALRKGDLATATKLVNGTDNADNKAIVAILNGKYDEAVACGAKHPLVTTLAYILVGDLDKAAAEAAKGKCEKIHYMKAIIAARQGNVDEAKKCLEKAAERPVFKARMAKDIEFVAINK